VLYHPCSQECHSREGGNPSYLLRKHDGFRLWLPYATGARDLVGMTEVARHQDYVGSIIHPKGNEKSN